jgi:N-acetylmuramoyl-L-alanine amidase
MKKIHYLILIAVGLTILFHLSSALAQSSEIKILMDNKPLELDVLSIMEDNQIFIPARNIVDALGGRITWFPTLKLLTINIDNHIVRLVIDEFSLEMDGKKIPLKTPAKVIDNRVMLPLEVIKIITPVEVEWDNQAKTLSINTINTINTIRPYLLKVRSYSDPDKTRIVIDLSEKTEFKANNLTNPDEIFIDIIGSILKLEDTFKEIEINDGILKTVRTAQFNEEITRVVFDLYQEVKYNIFSLTDPDRVVIDIFRPEKKSEPLFETLPPKPEEKPVLEPKVTGKRVVIIDPGHGGSDPGAIGPTGLKESEVNLKVALHLEELLKKAGIPTYLTRYKDDFISLEGRTNFANQKNGFIFVSIHANSTLNNRPTAIGTETFVLNSKYIGASAKDVADRENRASRAHPEVDTDLASIIGDLEESANIKYSFDFADIVQKELLKYLKLENRGVKQAPFVVLKGVNMAAVIVEIAFISNPQEEKLLKNNEFSQKAAQALFDAISYYIENIPNEM